MNSSDCKTEALLRIVAGLVEVCSVLFAYLRQYHETGPATIASGIGLIWSLQIHRSMIHSFIRLNHIN